MLFYGIHQPKAETIENIYDYLERKKINDDNIYFFKDSLCYFDFLENQNKTSKVNIYNKDQFLLRIIQKDTCSAQTEEMINELSLTNNYAIDSTNTLGQSLLNYVDRYGKGISVDSLAQSDYYVLMYWAKFAGKLNKKNTAFWEKELNSKGDEMNIKIFKICCDPLQIWW